MQIGLKLYNWLIFQITAIGLLMTLGGVSLTGLTSEQNVIDLSLVSEIKNFSTKEYVEKYFSDIPVLAEVAKCESQYRQDDKNGETLKGKINEFDLGVMQVNELYHSKKAQELGFDLRTIEGNTAYARYLFEKEGLKPWSSSSKCWKKSQAYLAIIK